MGMKQQNDVIDKQLFAQQETLCDMFNFSALIYEWYCISYIDYFEFLISVGCVHGI